MAGFKVLISGLRRAEAQLEGQLEGVRNAISALAVGGVDPQRGGVAGRRGPGRPKGSGKSAGRRKMSAEARAKISAAQKARWAKQKAKK